MFYVFLTEKSKIQWWKTQHEQPEAMLTILCFNLYMYITIYRSQWMEKKIQHLVTVRILLTFHIHFRLFPFFYTKTKKEICGFHCL